MLKRYRKNVDLRLNNNKDVFRNCYNLVILQLTVCTFYKYNSETTNFRQKFAVV